jgi:methylated-DNA-[protein]-cysteine S-methyltransferase
VTSLLLQFTQRWQVYSPNVLIKGLIHPNVPPGTLTKYKDMPMKQALYTHRYALTMDSPLGPLVLLGNGKYLTAIHHQKKPVADKATLLSGAKDAVLVKAKKQLEQYFLGKRAVFDVPHDAGGTLFQKKVWRALLKIPFGKTASYKDIAVMIGNPNASRAVGNANNKNPLCIVVPCHRVIGANGKLVGYAGGLSRKKILLNLERQYL